MCSWIDCATSQRPSRKDYDQNDAAKMTRAAGPAPPIEDTPAKGYGSWVPHDLPYNEDFENSLIDIVLDGPSDPNDTGIRAIHEDSDEAPVEGVSVRSQDIDRTTLPDLTEHDAPIPLTDPRRIYAGHIPGIKLTHPYGWVEGGPPLDPGMDTFSEDFLSQHTNITNAEQLQQAIQKEVETNMEELKKRLRARRKAKEANEQIRRDLRNLNEQHDMEMRLHQRMQDDQRKKREARKKKSEKDGGG